MATILGITQGHLEQLGAYKGGDVTLDKTLSIRNLVATRRLTVWRYLHVEVDAMGEVWNPGFLTAFNVLYATPRYTEDYLKAIRGTERPASGSP